VVSSTEPRGQGGGPTGMSLTEAGHWPVQRGMTHRRPAAVGLLAVSVVVTALFAAPATYLVVEAISTGPRLLEILGSPRIRRPLANSLLLATSVALTCGLLGTVLAVLVGRTDLPGRRVWRLVLPLPLVVPSFVAATALVAAAGPGGLFPALPRPEGFWGAFVVLTLLCYPYVYLPVLGRLAVTSSSMEEASRLLGHGAFSTMFRVLLPQLRSAASGGALLVFLYVLSDFGAVAILRYDTITRVLYAARLFDRDLALTLGLLLGGLALLVAVGARRIAGEEVGRHSVRGRTTAYRLGRLRWPVLVAVAAPVTGGLLIPMGIFLGWMVRGSTTVGTGYSGLGDDLAFLVEPLLGSAAAAVAAAVTAIVAVLPLGYLTVRRPSRWSGFSEALISSVFALPGIVVALAIAAWAVNAPEAVGFLYQSFPLLVLGYLLHFGVQSLRATQSAFGGVPDRLGESAAVLGAGPSRRFWSIDLPLIVPGVLAGGGLVLLSTLKELPMTLLLAPIGLQTLATTIWNAAEEGFYAEVGITSLVLILLSGVLTWMLVLRPAERR
jgi:iron(III) transport system permease protein